MRITISTKDIDVNLNIDKYEFTNGFLCLYNAKAYDCNSTTERLYVPCAKITMIQVNGIEEKDENTNS